MSATPSAAYPASENVVEERPDEYLSNVRDRSCYQTLRSLVNIVTAIGLIATGLVMLAGLQRCFGSAAALRGVVGDQLDRLGDGLMGGVITILIGLFGMILVVAARQSSLLLVDIADVLIDRGRHRWEFKNR